MPDCPTCGTALDDGVQFCPRDGTTIASTAAAAPKAPPREPPDPLPDPLIGRLLDGRYRVRARLGQGGVGAVYEGEHVEMKRPVAVKVLHAMFAGTEEFRKRFEREAQAASRLSHPACVQVLDFGRVARVEPAGDEAGLVGMPYLVMEFVRGRTLIDVVEAGGVTAHQAVAIVRGVLAALAHAHGLGLVHRDIKPANIMLLPESGGEPVRVKLLDFGLAKDIEGGAASETLTQAGTVFGTPGYLSPEQAAGRPADTRADLYALGVVLFELACGRRLFPRADPLDVVRAHLTEAPERPRAIRPSLSAELEAAILRALQKDPAARWAGAREMDAALAACPEARVDEKSSAPWPVAAPQSKNSRTPPASEKSRAPSDSNAPDSHAPEKPRAPSDLNAPDSRGPDSRAPGKAARIARPAWLTARVMAAGGLAATLLIVVIVLLARGKPAPIVAPAPVAAAPAAPIADGARRHLELALGYQRKLWCSDALEELDRALRDEPRLRTDPDAARCAIACLTPKTQPKAIRFLVEKLGDDARAPLTDAAASDPNPEIRHGAERALERLR